MRKDCLRAYPQAAEALSLLAGRLDNAAMQRLNFQVDGKGMQPADAAKRFLENNMKKGRIQHGKAKTLIRGK